MRLVASTDRFRLTDHRCGPDDDYMRRGLRSCGRIVSLADMTYRNSTRANLGPRCLPLRTHDIVALRLEVTTERPTKVARNLVARPPWWGRTATFRFPSPTDML